MEASVIIPAYNAEKTIGNCISSILNQSFRDFEIIVVDDGSSDNTAEVVKGFPSVKLLRQKNLGPAAARNNGGTHASGGYLVFLDSDCVANRNWLREMLAPFKDRAIAGVQGRYKNKQKELIARFIHLEIEERYEKMAKHRYIDFIGSYSAAYRVDVFKEMKGFDTFFPMASGEDTDLSFRIHEAGYKMIFNPKAIVYHSHPISFWKFVKVKFFRALWRTKIYKKHKKKVLKDAYTSQMVKVQTGLFYLIVLSLLAIPFGFNGLFYSAGLFALLLLSTVPFTLWVATKDPAVAVISPVLIVVRTTMFGVGLVLGIANYVRRHL